MTFMPTGRRNRVTRATITVVQAGKVLRRVHAVSRVRYYPGEDVYEDQDDFVNYCINENRPIYSRNHRLYYVNPELLVRRVALTTK